MVYLRMVNMKNTPRILIYSPIYYPDIGGPAVQAKFLTEMLCENGFEVFVIKYNNVINFNILKTPLYNATFSSKNANPELVSMSTGFLKVIKI